ncbi:MAG: hypothetical protein PUC26_04275 [Eubacteriales bacterium]|jgi:cytoskeletal protein RodZ|nr:hypothetical protein [Eubacteriales bacterium]
MARKKTRNKARDMIGDYWKTNRQAERENEAARKRQQEGRSEKEKKQWTSTEKGMLVVIIIGLVGIFFRYVVFR